MDNTNIIEKIVQPFFGLYDMTPPTHLTGEDWFLGILVGAFVRTLVSGAILGKVKSPKAAVLPQFLIPILTPVLLGFAYFNYYLAGDPEWFSYCLGFMWLEIIILTIAVLYAIPRIILKFLVKEKKGKKSDVKV